MPAELYAASGGANRKLREVYAASGGANRKMKEMYAVAGGASRKIFSAGVGYTTEAYTSTPGVYGLWSTINTDGSGSFNMSSGNSRSASGTCYLKFTFETPINVPIAGLVNHLSLTCDHTRRGVYSEHSWAMKCSELSSIAYGKSNPTGQGVVRDFPFNKVSGQVSSIVLSMYGWEEGVMECGFDVKWQSGGLVLFGHPITAPTGVLPIVQ